MMALVDIVRGYLSVVVSILELKERLAQGGNWVLFDSHGVAIETPIPGDLGPATLLVAPVIDALKTTNSDGLVDRSLNRDDIWAVKGFALNRVVVDRLEPVSMAPRQLFDAISDLRFGWQVKALAEM